MAILKARRVGRHRGDLTVAVVSLPSPWTDRWPVCRVCYVAIDVTVTDRSGETTLRLGQDGFQGR
ncbi:hypothetical protein GCM10023195_10770 [Actinoallomurus liliacearum]|uniref:Uncharacterized protein n=1 Tax=Actinoallomurus liliacearum TaxID=1080073 RepID=A0ABP8TEW6_9ACTN